MDLPEEPVGPNPMSQAIRGPMLAAVRKYLNVTQAEIARVLGCKQESYVSLMERGRMKVTDEGMRKIELEYNIKFGDFSLPNVITQRPPEIVGIEFDGNDPDYQPLGDCTDPKAFYEKLQHILLKQDLKHGQKPYYDLWFLNPRSMAFHDSIMIKRTMADNLHAGYNYRTIWNLNTTEHTADVFDLHKFIDSANTVERLLCDRHSVDRNAERPKPLGRIHVYPVLVEQASMPSEESESESLAEFYNATVPSGGLYGAIQFHPIMRITSEHEGRHTVQRMMLEFNQDDSSTGVCLPTGYNPARTYAYLEMSSVGAGFDALPESDKRAWVVLGEKPTKNLSTLVRDFEKLTKQTAETQA